MKKSAFVIATAACAFATAAMAQTTNPAVEPGSTKAAPPTFMSMDTNKDGKVSRAEARAHGELNTSFGTLDGDKDDNLSETEYGKWNAKPGTGGMTPGTNRGTGTGAGSGSQSTPGGNMQTNPGGMQPGAPRSNPGTQTAPGGTRDSTGGNGTGAGTGAGGTSGAGGTGGGMGTGTGTGGAGGMGTGTQSTPSQGGQAPSGTR